MKYVVAFYAVDRAYGGPEEGGWWFDTGELVRLHRVCLTEAAAARLAVRANRLLDLVQRGHCRLDYAHEKTPRLAGERLHSLSRRKSVT